MSLSFFIAKRIYQAQEGKQRISRPAVVIAVAGIALGLAIMLIAVSVVIGFKREVSAKVVGFGADLQVSPRTAASFFDAQPMVADEPLMQLLNRQSEVAHAQRYTLVPGIVKTADNFEGMVLKGVGADFDAEFIQSCMLEGEFPTFSDTAFSQRAVISRSIADRLHLKVGDRMQAYFVQDKVRVRQFLIAGIYQTNFAEYDVFVWTDRYATNRLNGWQPDEVSGVELRLKDAAHRLEAHLAVAMAVDSLGEAMHREGYVVKSIQERHPQVFAWLDLLDLNVWVILILMVGVAGFTMISGLLILILERTQMIGLFKALGASDALLQRGFLWLSVFLIGRGMMWGNILGLGLIGVQKQWGLLSLDPRIYYVDRVPVGINIWLFLAINIGTLLASVLILVGPSYLISKIRPASSMRYE